MDIILKQVKKPIAVKGTNILKGEKNNNKRIYNLEFYILLQ